MDATETQEFALLTERFKEILPSARLAAHRQGTMHPWWDVITDGECAVDDKPTLLKGTRVEVLREVVRILSRPSENR